MEQKQTIKLNESQLRKVIKEALNEIGDTPKGQEALGALHAKKVYNNSRINYKKTGELAHNPTSDEKEVYDYAKKKRGNNNDMETAYASGYIKQRDKENSKGINEMKLNEGKYVVKYHVGTWERRGGYGGGWWETREFDNERDAEKFRLKMVQNGQAGEIIQKPKPKPEPYPYNTNIDNTISGLVDRTFKNSNNGDLGLFENKQPIRINESQLRQIIKENIKKVLRENYQMDDWRMGDWRTFPMPEPDDKFSVVLLNRNNDIVRETAKYFKNVKDAYDYYKMIARQTPKQGAVMFRKPQHAGEPWIRVRTSNKI